MRAESEGRSFVFMTSFLLLEHSEWVALQNRAFPFNSVLEDLKNIS